MKDLTPPLFSIDTGESMLTSPPRRGKARLNENFGRTGEAREGRRGDEYEIDEVKYKMYKKHKRNGMKLMLNKSTRFHDSGDPLIPLALTLRHI